MADMEMKATLPIVLGLNILVWGLYLSTTCRVHDRVQVLAPRYCSVYLEVRGASHTIGCVHSASEYVVEEQ